jgi:phage terminase small subunit|tara:strand:- start:5136 stop:5693 length:558 start_codon:yes stop_codon:yes gene_type:complete
MAKKSVQTIEEEHGRKLTNRQINFAKHFVEGIYSNAECARKAGYAVESANVQASKFLNGRDFPQVLEYIKELREERERRYGVTLIGQLKRLQELSENAESEGQFSAAINAEKIRSALGGLTIDRREVTNKLDDMSREEIVARLATLRKQHPQAFIEGEFEEVKDVNGVELLEINEEKSAREVARN